MENERVLIAMDRESFKAVLNEMFKPDSNGKILPEFEEDKLLIPQAAKFVGVSIVTLRKLMLAGKFKQYSAGKRKFYLKSEIIQALKTQ